MGVKVGDSEDNHLALLVMYVVIAFLLICIVVGLVMRYKEYEASTQVSTKELKCQHRRSWLRAAEAYDNAFLSCAKHYEGALYSSKLIAERCDEEVSRSHEPRWRIKQQLELSRKYANQCGVEE